MKKLIFLLIVTLFSISLMGCPGTPPPIEPETTPVVTEPVVEDDSIKEETPPPPPPTLKESQFATVYFDFDKYSLRGDAKVALDQNYGILKEFVTAVVTIEGHCDERGTVEYNLSLGDKRAKATMDYLVGLGIDPGRISIISYGKERPVDNGHTEAAWGNNRRCEFRVITQ
jgi:peptidoglycan-associated lipoprotein